MTHQPKRGDEIETWLKKRRNEYPAPSRQWDVVDMLLDEYRERADYGVSLEGERPEL